MKKVFVLITMVALLGGVFFGCGHHKRPKVYNNISVIDSSTHPGVPCTVIIQQPPPFDQDALIAELISELEAFEQRQEIEVNVVIEIDNDVTVENEVVVEGDKIVVKPGKLKRIPGLYHWLSKFYKKKCKVSDCDEFPKPCDNEDD